MFQGDLCREEKGPPACVYGSQRAGSTASESSGPFPGLMQVQFVITRQEQRLEGGVAGHRPDRGASYTSRQGYSLRAGSLKRAELGACAGPSLIHWRGRDSGCPQSPCVLPFFPHVPFFAGE